MAALLHGLLLFLDIVSFDVTWFSCWNNSRTNRNMQGFPRSTAGTSTQSKLKANVKEMYYATIMTIQQTVWIQSSIYCPTQSQSSGLRYQSSRSQSPPMQLEPPTLGHSDGTPFMALGNLTEIRQEQTMPDSKLCQP